MRLNILTLRDTERVIYKILTCAVEEVRSLQEVSRPDEGSSVLRVQERSPGFVQLAVLHDLQPLAVVQAELLVLDLLAPLLIVLLEETWRRVEGG